MVVPTYDEREALPLADRGAPTGFDLLSSTTTRPTAPELAYELAASRPWMHVLRREEMDGLGNASRAGFSVPAAVDCDLSHPTERLVEMRALLRCDADLVLGSRYVPAAAPTAGARLARQSAAAPAGARPRWR